MEASLPQWSNEVVAESFRAEIRARFEAHNDAYRAREAAELETILREHPEQRGKPGYEVRDSFAWEVYQASSVPPADLKLCERARREDLDRYGALEADVFDATVPFGSTTKAKR
jgi:hypothetical protein